MISIDEINEEIAKLESQTPTYQSIQTLASLYTVRDHMDRGAVPKGSGSPFIERCNGISVCDLMAVMDELMTTVQIMQPKLYDAVMTKLQP